MDRVTNGLPPACAKACPTGALTFGDYDKILDLAHKAKARLEQKGRNPQIYGEKELGTGTRKIYVLPEPVEFYPDLLKNPKVSEDLGFFHELLKPLGKLTLTAALVGMTIAKVKQTKEKTITKVQKEEKS